MSKYSVFKIIFLSLFFFQLGNFRTVSAASILVPEDVYDSYIKFLNLRSPLDISDFSGNHSRRDVVELILMQQALKVGGYTDPIKFISSLVSYPRALKEVGEGNVDAFANTVFNSDTISTENTFYKSDVTRGAFRK